MARRDEIVSYLDDLLEPAAFDDHGPNGLQVPGSEDVEVVVGGVSASLELFERAAEVGARLVLCHHGLFWDFHPRSLSPAMKRRLEVLFAAEATLLAYHLPLDAHPEHGNNALLCEALGLERAEPFGVHRGRPIGFVGRSEEGVEFDELLSRCHSQLGQKPFAWQGRGASINSVGIVSGAGASTFRDAIEAGLDAFLTGEAAEHVMADARESGVHFIAAGHYATETLGVRRLGDLLTAEFGVEHHFADIPNPV